MIRLLGSVYHHFLKAEDDSPKLPVLPPVLPAITLSLAIVGEWLWPLDFLDGRTVGWQRWIGLSTIAIGLILGLSGVHQFLRFGTHVEPTKPALTLVVTGPYRLTRNPMYWGFLFLILGLSLIFALEWGLLLLPPLWLALDRIIVVREERYLTERFGSQYTDYLRQTRRWI